MVPRFCRVLGWGARIELRNVVAEYPVGRSHRFPAISRIPTAENIRAATMGAQLAPSLLPGAKLSFSGLWSTVCGKANPRPGGRRGGKRLRAGAKSTEQLVGSSPDRC